MRAPELKALMTILRSPAGPVISTRRSCRSAGTGATRQSSVADRARRLEEVRELARSDPLLALRPREQELLPPTGELALQRDDEVERLRSEDARLVGCVDDGARDGAQRYTAASNCASSVEPLSASVELSPPVTASSTASK